MTEATQRPLAGAWWQDPNDNRIHDAEGNDVLDHITVTEIGRRVNNHDVLVAALEFFVDSMRDDSVGDIAQFVDGMYSKAMSALGMFPNGDSREDAK